MIAAISWNANLLRPFLHAPLLMGSPLPSSLSEVIILVAKTINE
jgi:hypothetical protein